jgi:hypothetical protein
MRTVNALVLAAVLLAGSGSFLDQISSFVSSFWAPSASVDGGCQLDPNGKCQPAPRQDNGCELDPYGKCSPAPSQDSGCQLDPYGRPVCSPEGS